MSKRMLLIIVSSILLLFFFSVSYYYINATLIPAGTVPVDGIGKDGELTIQFFRKNALPPDFTIHARVSLLVRENIALQQSPKLNGDITIIDSIKYVSVLIPFSAFRKNNLPGRLKVSVHGSEKDPDYILPSLDASYGTVFLTEKALNMALQAEINTRPLKRKKRTYHKK